MSKKRGLGKGLGALIPDNIVVDDSDIEKVQNIKVKDIVASKDNPRKNFDEEGISSLAESIKLYGIIQPLVLIKKANKYEIIAGERRFRAASLLELEEVPAIVKNLTTKDKDMISMVENIQREDLNPYEEALAYKNIMKQYSLTQQELADLVGKTRVYIANIVRLLSLDENTLEELSNGNITSSQGRALLSVEDLSKRQKYLQMLIRNEITVNELEGKKKSSKKKTKDVFVKDIEERIKEAFGTKVKVSKSKKKWNINLVFSDDEHLEDFLERFGVGE